MFPHSVVQGIMESWRASVRRSFLILLKRCLMMVVSTLVVSWVTIYVEAADCEKIDIECEGDNLAETFIYPVDRGLTQGDARWKSRGNGQSHGSLANDGFTGQHIGEDWNWGACDADYGECVFIVADGEVVETWPDITKNDWGKCVLIEHRAPPGEVFIAGNGRVYDRVYSFYAHLQRIDVDKGDCVAKGSTVGTVGDANGWYRPKSVGGEDGWPHLHFELRVPVDENDQGMREGAGGRGGGYVVGRAEILAGAVSPSEFIENNLVVGGKQLSVWVHPYEADAFELAGLWEPKGLGTFAPELGHGGNFYAKSADSSGSVIWKPRIPRSGYYRILQYLPGRVTQRIDTKVPFTVFHHLVEGSSGTVEVTVEADFRNHSDQWAKLESSNTPEGRSFYFRRSDQLDAAEQGRVVLDTRLGSAKSITADTMRFVYMGKTPASFVDVSADHFSYPYVEKLYQEGALGDSDDFRFHPSALVNRAAFLKMVVEAGCDDFDPDRVIVESPLPDVPTDTWYAVYVDFAKSKGLPIQCPAGFCPKDRVTREWAALVLKDVFPLVERAYDRVTRIPLGRSEMANSLTACWFVGAIEGLPRRGDIVLPDASQFLRRADAAKAVAVSKYGRWSF